VRLHVLLLSFKKKSCSSLPFTQKKIKTKQNKEKTDVYDASYVLFVHNSVV